MVQKACDYEDGPVELGKTGPKHDVHGTQYQLIEEEDRNYSQKMFIVGGYQGDAILLTSTHGFPEIRVSLKLK